MNDNYNFSKFQTIIATIFYISLVIACLIAIGGVVYTIADLIMASGKLELFQGINLGYQIAIIGALFAGLFVLIVIGIGLGKKGKGFLLKTIFRKKTLHSKYKNRTPIKIITICLLLSIFSIIIGLIAAFLYDLIMGVSFPSSQIFSQGQITLFVGIMLLIVIGLIIGLFYLWQNGYYLIISMFYTLEKSLDDEKD